MEYNDEHAEQASLASIIMNPTIGHDFFDRTTEDMYYEISNRVMYGAIKELVHDDSAIDFSTIKAVVDRKSRLSDCSLDYIVGSCEMLPSAASWEYYTTIVIDKYHRRRARQYAQDVLNASASDNSIEDMHGLLQTGLDVIVKDGSPQPFLQVSDVALTASFDKGDYVPTPWSSVNNLIHGFKKSQVTLVAARPSIGKSAFMNDIALGWGWLCQEPVGYFILEDNENTAVTRMLCTIAKVDSQDVLHGRATQAELNKIESARKSLNKEAKIIIDTTPGLKPSQLYAKGMRMKREHGITCVLVDYFNLMSPDNKGAQGTERFSGMAKEIQAVCRKLDLPLVLACQLNRNSTGREDKRPRMSDLKETGTLEEVARTIILLHREDEYRGMNEERDGLADIVIAKAEGCPTGQIRLRYTRELTTFTEQTS
jgi:replicative DNA helicase